MNSAVARVLTGRLASIVARGVLRAGREMERVASLDASAVEALQFQKLHRLLAHFRSYPFYRDMLSSAGVGSADVGDADHLKRLPVMTKEIITQHFDYLGGRPTAARTAATSGSTGVNFRFHQSKSMIDQRSASVRRAYASIGIEMWGDRGVSIWGVAPRGSLSGRVALAVKQFLLNSSVWQGFGLDDEMCVAYLTRLGRVRPKLLVGYPSYLRRMAVVGRARGVATYQPRAIVCSGEMMLDRDRELIEGYFQSPVYNRYGSCEFGLIGQECSHRTGMHIPPTRLIVESGDEGLLITDLDNLATPFVRYAIGDAGVVGDVSCPCGHTGKSLLSLEGRLHDEITTPSGKLLGGQFWTIMSKSVAGIDELQVVQHSPESLELRIKVTDEYRDEYAEVLRDKVRALAGDEVRLVVTKVDRIEPTASGKRRFIINAMERAGGDD